MMRALRDREVGNLSSIGGKALNLAMLGSSFRVPPFVVLMPDMPRDAEIPADLERQVEGYLGDSVFAVRSSANVEDARDASFAGLFETRLGVPLSELRGAVMEVVASATSERVTAYRESKSSSMEEVQMSVVIQRMVAADRAGVCLTHRSPDDQVVVVEAIYGLGDLLVSGAVEPDTYLVDRLSRQATLVRTGYQPVALTMEEGQVVRVQVPSTDRNAPKLLLSEARAIAEMSIAIEQRQGYAAADVEWAYEDSILYLLQARPYAAIQCNSA